MYFMRSLVVRLAVLAACAAVYPRAASAQTVSVDLNSSLGTVPPYGLGLGVAVWDGNLMDSVIPSLVSSAGYKIWRFPGGSYSDLYNWQTNAAVPGQSAYIVAADSFDNFMSQVKAADGTALITVNYGSNFAGTGGGDPNEAAAWVRYSNITKGYGIKYWEIGNEIYGNGFYGSSWEVDLHSDKSPSAYGNNLKAFSSAMKAVDSSIKIGAVVTTPGNWPDGQSTDWNSTVLSIACASIDFVVFHWYPSNNPLYAPQNEIPSIMSTLRSRISQYCGSRASSIEIWLTEGNWSGTTIDGALFGADQFLGWWEHGLASMDWWDLHNGISLNNGVNQDSGILANASCSGSTCEPAANTPFPIYYGTQMANYLAKPGDTLAATTSSASSLIAHAMKNGSRYGLMLINKDPNQTQSVAVTFTGGTPSATATRYYYGKDSTAVTTSSVSGLGGSFTVSVPPYSIVDLVGNLAGTGTTYTLTIAVSGTGTTTPAPGTYSYPAGTTVSVSAAGTGGATFDSWSGAATGSANPVSIVMNSDKVLTANFTVGACTSVPPAPTGLTATATSSSQINLSWSPVAVNTGCPAVTYRIYRSTTSGTQGSQIATGVTATSYSDTGLAAATRYYYSVQADKGSGNVSALSTQVSAVTQNGMTNGTCTATYSVTNSWPGGFQGALAVKNDGTTAMSSWTVTMTLASGQSITQVWNATLTTSGSIATVKNQSYNGTIAAGASYTGVGFLGSGTSSAPTSITCGP